MRIKSFLPIVMLAICSHAKALIPFETETMISGYCIAGSREDDKALGGYGRSSNAAKEITEGIPGTDGEISLIALPDDEVPFRKQYNGFRLLLINRTAKEVSLPASDSRLYIICEARDQDGEWKPIEYLPSSWCGNSHHSAYLPSGHYWEFSAPVYSGSLKTKLRYNLGGNIYCAELGGFINTYSNEFDGSINPSQFRKPETRR
jgi:hypothetical protein